MSNVTTEPERLHADKMKAFFDLADQSGDTMISRNKWKDVMASNLESTNDSNRAIGTEAVWKPCVVQRCSLISVEPPQIPVLEVNDLIHVKVQDCIHIHIYILYAYTYMNVYDDIFQKKTHMYIVGYLCCVLDPLPLPLPTCKVPVPSSGSQRRAYPSEIPMKSLRCWMLTAAMLWWQA